MVAHSTFNIYGYFIYVRTFQNNLLKTLALTFTTCYFSHCYCRTSFNGRQNIIHHTYQPSNALYLQECSNSTGNLSSNRKFYYSKKHSLISFHEAISQSSANFYWAAYHLVFVRKILLECRIYKPSLLRLFRTFSHFLFQLFYCSAFFITGKTHSILTD